MSAGDRKISRRYLIEFGAGMIAYVICLIETLTWGHLDGESSARFAWALLPVVPALWIVVAVMRHMRRVDAYQRQMLFQGLSLGFALAMVASVTMGFLAIAGLLIPDMAWIIFGVGMLGWLVGSQIAKIR